MIWVDLHSLKLKIKSIHSCHRWGHEASPKDSRLHKMVKPGSEDHLPTKCRVSFHYTLVPTLQEWGRVASKMDSWSTAMANRFTSSCIYCILARDAQPDHGARWGRFARQLSHSSWNSPQKDLGTSRLLNIRLLRQTKVKVFVLFRGLAILGTAHHFPNGRPRTQRWVWQGDSVTNRSV